MRSRRFVSAVLAASLVSFCAGAVPARAEQLGGDPVAEPQVVETAVDEPAVEGDALVSEEAGEELDGQLVAEGPVVEDVAQDKEPEGTAPTAGEAQTEAVTEEPALEAQAVDVTDSGTWGTCPWELTADGVLTVHPGVGKSTSSSEDEPYSRVHSPWETRGDKIKEVRFVSEGGKKVVAPSVCNSLFYPMKKLTSVDVSGLDFSQVVYAQGMFQQCHELAYVDLSTLDTSSLQDASVMFSDCISLKTANLAGWDTSNLTEMSCMFRFCSALTSVDTRGWDTSQVTNMSWMFGGCEALATVDVSGWDVSSVTDMSKMFSECYKLTSLDVSKWDTSSLVKAKSMFDCCTSLEQLDVSNWDVSKLEEAYCMFANCGKLASLDVSAWNPASLWNVTSMFRSCSSLTSLDVSGWDMSKAVDLDYMFSGCLSLESLELSGWQPKPRALDRMFEDCSSLKDLDLSGFNTSRVSSFTEMFRGCSSLQSLDLSSFDTRKASSRLYNYPFDRMFEGCSSLKEIRIGENYTPGATEDAFPNATAGSNKWWSQAERAWYTKAQIAEDRSGIADAYYSSEQPQRSLNVDAVTIKVGKATYTGAAVKPSVVVRYGQVELKAGTDYTVSFENNTKVGTAYAVVTGKGAYKDTKETKFTIEKADIAGAEVEPIADREYTRYEQEPEVTATFNGKPLTKNTDYTLSYKDNVNAGTATITLTGKGNFQGTKPVYFTITPFEDFAWAGQISPIDNQTYTGKAITPAITVTYFGVSLEAGTDYTVSYANNVNVGTATVTVTGKGNYAGTLKPATFNIVEPVQDDPVDPDDPDPVDPDDPDPVDPDEQIFPDVPAGKWYTKVVERAAELGLITGYDDGRFGPDDNITRAQVAVILWRMAGMPKAGAGAKSFSDVKSGAYYYSAVRWASSVGVVSGYADGTFGSVDEVTREQLAVMLANYAKKIGGLEVRGSAADYASMKDADAVAGYAAPSMGWCFRNKILSGTADGRVDPKGNATRAQAAKMLVFLYDMLP